MAIEQIMSHFGAGHSHSHGAEGATAGDTHTRSHANEGQDGILSSSFSLAALVGLGVHSFVDGVMIGGAFSASMDVGGRVGLAIVLHKLPDGFVLASILQGIGNSFANSPSARRNTLLGFMYRYMSFFLILGVCLMTPVGALASYTLLEGENLQKSLSQS